MDISRQSANALCDAAHLGCPEATAALVPLTRADDSHIVRISRDSLLAVSSSAGEAEALASQETETSGEHPVNSSRASDLVSNDVDAESRTRLQRLNNSQHVDVNDDVGSVTLSDATGCDLPACFLSTSVWDLCDQTNDVVEEATLASLDLCRRTCHWLPRRVRGALRRKSSQPLQLSRLRSGFLPKEEL